MEKQLQGFVATTAANPITSNYNEFSSLTGEVSEPEMTDVAGEPYSNLFEGIKERKKARFEQRMAKKAAKTDIKKAKAEKKVATGQAKVLKAKAKTIEAKAKVKSAEAEKASAEQEGKVAGALAGQPAEGKSKTLLYVGIGAAALILVGGIAFFALRKK